MKSTNIILAIMVILTIFSVVILIIRYFLFPLFFQPKLNPTEMFSYLEKEGLLFVDSTYLTKDKRKKIDLKKSDESIIEKFISVKSNYLITVFSQQQNEIKLFLLEINNCLIPYPKWLYKPLVAKRIKNVKELNLIEVTDAEILKRAQKKYKNKIIVKDQCPACYNTVSTIDKVCSDCGLTLNII